MNDNQEGPAPPNNVSPARGTRRGRAGQTSGAAQRCQYVDRAREFPIRDRQVLVILRLTSSTSSDSYGAPTFRASARSWSSILHEGHVNAHEGFPSLARRSPCQIA